MQIVSCKMIKTKPKWDVSFNVSGLFNLGPDTGVSLTSWGEDASLALVGHPSSDGVTIKMPYGVYVLHRPDSHPIFSY